MPTHAAAAPAPRAGLTSVGLLVVGRWAWLGTEQRLRRLVTLGQH